jgi:hypothetical protein
MLAGALPTAIAVLAVVLAKMPKDELDHPLDIVPEPETLVAAADATAAAARS